MRSPFILGMLFVVSGASALASTVETRADVATLQAVICPGKSDGYYCDANQLVRCAGGSETRRQSCARGCLPGLQIGDAKCAGDVCDGVGDGTYCISEERAVYT